jgi:hypothetical protein
MPAPGPGAVLAPRLDLAAPAGGGQQVRRPPGHALGNVGRQVGHGGHTLDALGRQALKRRRVEPGYRRNAGPHNPPPTGYQPQRSSSSSNVAPMRAKAGRATWAT